MASTVTNGITLLAKLILLLPCCNPANHNHTYKFIKDKSIYDCIVLAIPFVNTVIMLRRTFPNFASFKLALRYQLYTKLGIIHNDVITNRELMLKAVQRNGLLLKDAPLSLKDDWELVKSAIQQDISSFQYASERIRGNTDYCIDLCKIQVTKEIQIRKDLLTQQNLMTTIINFSGLQINLMN